MMTIDGAQTTFVYSSFEWKFFYTHEFNKRRSSADRCESGVLCQQHSVHTNSPHRTNEVEGTPLMLNTSQSLVVAVDKFMDPALDFSRINNPYHCLTPDSVIGFGIEHLTSTTTMLCGNFARKTSMGDTTLARSVRSTGPRPHTTTTA